jgi:hypothetical protein
VANPTIAAAATLAFQPDGGAAICLSRPHAVSFQGARTGDHVLVSNVDPAAPINVCTCLVVVVNEIEGDVVRDADGGFVSFTSSRWLSTLSAPDGGAGYPATQDGGVCGCGLPCQVLYTPDGGT